MKVLKSGMKDDEVRVLQLYLGLKDDGIFGSDTKKAVETFQKKYKLDADGIVGAKTWNAIGARLPVVRSGDQGYPVKILQILLKIAPVDGKFGPIVKDAVTKYQKSVSLAADGIAGRNTWGMIIGGTTKIAGNAVPDRPTDFKMFDSKWGKLPYTITGSKKQTIGSSACGPTTLADIIVTWKIDPDFTPPKSCDLAIKWGCRTKNDGTTTSFFKKAADHFGIKCSSAVYNVSEVKKALDEGPANTLVVARMGPKYFTSGGHYILLWKYDKTDIHVCDCGSSKSAKMKAPFSIFEKERKDFYIMRRK